MNDCIQTVNDVLKNNQTLNILEQAFNFLIPSDLNMYYCGKRINTYNHRYGPAICDHFLLVYINDGHGRLETNNKVFELKPNHLLVMFPDNKIFYEVDKGIPWTIQWVGLYGSLVYTYLDFLGITPQNPIFPVKNSNEVKNILEILYKKSSSNNLGDKIDCISLLHKFFAELAENKQITPQKNDYIEQAINFMKYNYEQGISSIDVANSLKIDRSYFSKVFKQETGLSPTQWLTNLRINKACKLLKETNLSISEIAYSVGIFDQFYFSRLFKRRTGLTPIEYRKA